MSKKYIIAICIIFSILLCSCNENSINDIDLVDEHVLLTINEEPILYNELERTKQRYEQTGLTEIELIEGIVLEAIVLDKATEYDISVSEDEVNEVFERLVSLNEGKIFYEKALESYGTDEKIKEAYYYSILYDKVKEKIKDLFYEDFSVENRVLELRTDDYIFQYELEEDDRNDFFEAVWDTYKEAIETELFDLYFKVWQYKQVEETQIEYIDVDETSLFCKYSYGIDENKLYYKGKEYELEDWSYEKTRELFGNILYLSDLTQTQYEDIEIKGLHNPEKDVKAIYVTLKNGTSASIIISVIVSPYISLNYEQQGLITMKKPENNNRVDLVQQDYGIHYSISSDNNSSELEKLLHEFIPYEVK